MRRFFQLSGKSRLFLLLAVVAVALITVMPTAASGGGLQAGEQVTFEQTLPVNLVFIGYDEGDVDEAALSAELPAGYDPVVRYPQFYGLPGRDLGLSFTFDYNFVYAGSRFENAFFAHLQDIGEPGDLTVFQSDYNAQNNNVLDVEGPVLYIDGPSVEQWLQLNKRDLGLRSDKAYTVFFVNWYGRDDFQFHLYTKTDEPDPDTGYNFGALRDSRKMIAWGGTYGRTWFYDLSAGPEAWTDNWNVDNPDLDGNGAEDYRMPPIWEYTDGGYRAPDQLSSDLGLVTRFVGINLLFSPSPLYDPLVTAPGADGRRVAHLEMFEDDPNSSGLDWINPNVVHDEFAAFQPYYPWKVALEDNDPIDPGAEQALRTFTEVDVQPGCWQNYGTPFAQLYCYFNENYDQYVPAYKEADYVGTVFSFNTTDANMGSQFGLLGFADDNWIDGTQSYVFQFDTPTYRDLGYGFSATTVHELGHHYGLSHPHDGYDAEYGIDYGPSDDFYFAWSGNESDTVMHYLAISNGFGQFNQDTMNRFEFAGYLNWSNALLAEIQAHPNARLVQRLVSLADRRATSAVSDFNRWNYLKAAANARATYSLLATAADLLNIETPADNVVNLQAVSDPHALPHDGDPIRFPYN